MEVKDRERMQKGMRVRQTASHLISEETPHNPRPLS